MFKLLGDLVNSFRGGCSECGRRDDLMVCKHCGKILCEECFEKDSSLRLEKCKKTPLSDKKHGYTREEEALREAGG